MLKRWMATLLIVQLTFFNFKPAYSASESPVEELRKKLATLRTHYGPYLDSSYKNLLATYYSLRSQDHIRALYQLEEKSLGGSQRISSYLRSYNSAYSAIEAQSGSMESESIALYANLAMVEREVRRARILAADNEALAGSWSDACGNEKINYLADFFHPSRLFSPENIAFFQPTPENVGIGISYGYSGTGHNVEPGANNLGLSEEESAAMITAPIVGFAAGGPYGAAIAIVACVLYGLVKFFSAGWNLAREETEQWNLIRQIRELQANVISAKSAMARSVVVEECGKSFPTELKARLQSQLVASYREETERTAAQMRANVDRDLRPKLEEFFRNLEEVYLPRLEQRFVQEMRAVAVEALYRERAVDEFVRTRIEPIGERILAGGNSFALTPNRQRLWTQMIAGDALYRKGEAISPAPASNSSLENSWSDWARLFQEDLL